MVRHRLRQILRVVFSISVILAIVAVCQNLSHLNTTTAALSMLLAVLLIAANWGFTEAIAASIAGVLGFDYFFLRPRGLRIEEPQYWLAQLAFVATAIIGSRLSTNIKKRAAEANASREDIEKLYKLQRLIHMDHNLLDNLERVPERIEQIFGFGGVACDFEGVRESTDLGL